jgi:hypothetical protein
MTNNKQQTEINAVEYLDKVNQFAKENNTGKPKQQTAVEFYLDKVFDIIGDAILDKLSIEQINKIHDLSKQAKEMEKEQRSIKLPSDEEIEKESFDLYANHNTYSLNVRQYKAFKGGAKWMRDKIRIQGGNK